MDWTREGVNAGMAVLFVRSSWGGEELLFDIVAVDGQEEDCVLLVIWRGQLGIGWVANGVSSIQS